MWDWESLFPVSSSFDKKYPNFSYPQKNLLPLHQIPHESDCCSALLAPIASFKMILASLLSRGSSNNSSNNAIVYVKYLCLVVFSPLILPLFFAFFPFLLALEIFCRFCRRRWRAKRMRRRRRRRKAEEDCGEVAVVGIEEMGNGQRLLQRYLEDQLLLVVGSLYDQCAGAEEEGEEQITEADDVLNFDSHSHSAIIWKN